MTFSRFAVTLYVIGAISALLSVIMAAFASHGLLQTAPTGEQAVTWFRIAVEFQMDHALGIIVVAAISDRVSGRAQKLMRAAAVLLVMALLFPVALYSLSFHGPSFFAPWGGFAAMAGWALFAVGAVLAYKSKA